MWLPHRFGEKWSDMGHVFKREPVVCHNYVLGAWKGRRDESRMTPRFWLEQLDRWQIHLLRLGVGLCVLLCRLKEW